MKEKPNRIFELRRKSGISQERLAEELNVTQASVSLYENGTNIPTDVLIKIAGYFDVSIEYLLKITNAKYNLPIENLTESEHRILLLYRNLPTDHKKMIDKVVNIIGSDFNLS